MKVLVIGSPGNTVYAGDLLESDPLTYPVVVLSRAGTLGFDAVMRSIRLYFPRSYEDLSEYEYIMMYMVEILYFTDNQVWMLHDAIRDEGLGANQGPSCMTMIEDWAQSILSNAFPNDADAVVHSGITNPKIPVRYVINTNPNVPPIFKPYKDLEGVEFAWFTESQERITIPREGAIVTSYTTGAFPVGYPGAYSDPGFKTPGWIPHSMYWQYGKGITWTHQDHLGGYWNTRYNPYGLDMILAEILFSTGRELPEDVLLVHQLRARFRDIRASKSLALAFLEFADKYGADTSTIANKMVETSDKTKEAEELYLAQDYDPALSTIEMVFTDMESIGIMAIKLKDQALAWVYLIEWLAVSGAFLLTGITIWTLMIKKRLYREVSSTRIID